MFPNNNSNRRALTARNNRGNRRSNTTRVLSARSTLNAVHQGPELFAQTIYNVPDLIPEHTANPRVTRIVRIYTTLTSASPTVSVSYGTLSLQDGTDYNGSSSVRYANMRVHSAKVWLEIPNGLSVAVQPPTLILQEAASAYRVSDRGLAGSRYAKAGLVFSWQVRQAIVATNVATNILTVSTDVTIPASTIIPVTIDVVCEFL